MKRINIIKALALGLVLALGLCLMDHFKLSIYIQAVFLGIMWGLNTCILCTDGVIRINTEDPDKDVYTLELGIAFGELNKRRVVMFKIDK